MRSEDFIGQNFSFISFNSFSLTLENRIVFPPMNILGSSTDGYVTDADVNYYTSFGRIWHVDYGCNVCNLISFPKVSRDKNMFLLPIRYISKFYFELIQYSNTCPLTMHEHGLFSIGL
ncbi:hypothetical protein DET54_11347 [Paenibacillus pabuli]|uniref:Uncharacterized protein n=1 Tax=Paenibacillus pabuli TaxID=1472 RepID=A0ABX9BFA2_9BACL|nr:hypothetical protein DET54_11347 [Paenibacillus pabuli]